MVKLVSHLSPDVQKYRNVNKSTVNMMLDYLDIVKCHNVLMLQFLERRNQISYATIPSS